MTYGGRGEIAIVNGCESVQDWDEQVLSVFSITIYTYCDHICKRMQELTSYNIDLVFNNGSRSTYVFYRPRLHSGPQVVRDVIDLLTHQQIVTLLTTTTKIGVSACFFLFQILSTLTGI